MASDWLHSISKIARVEGRSAVIFFALVFCGFLIYVFANAYERNPTVGWFFLMVSAILLAAFVIIVGLLFKPQPSEIVSKWFLQQRGPDFLAAGGLQSNEAVLEFLRLAHNIQELPPPVAIVDGSATDEKAYRALTPEQALEFVRKDREGVRQRLSEEAAEIQSLLFDKQALIGGPQREITGQPERILAENKNEQKDDKKKAN